MSHAAKKLAQQVAEIRSLPDNKRCFNCETLGTTYYVPQLSIFVCTQCSGIHMQFAHRVKSVTLAEYKADEIEHMRQGGNQVAAYRYLARYTPDKDLHKPLDRNPQRIRTWIQTVFMDKRYFSADAPIPRRSTDGAAAAAAAGSSSGSTGGVALTPSASIRRASSAHEGSAVTSPLPSPASAAATAAHAEPNSPPVRDMRELLGDRATSLQVGPKASSGNIGSSSRATSVAAALQPAAQAPAAPKPAPATPSQQRPAFDPFAAPETAVTTPAMPAMQATPLPATPGAAAGAAAAAASGTAAAPAAASSGWASFDEPPAFGATQGQGAPAAFEQPAAPSVAAPAAVGAAANTTGWATFGDNTFGAAAPAAATPAAPPPAAAAPVAAPAHVAGGTTAAAGNAASLVPAAAGVTGGSVKSGGGGSSAAAASSPATPTGSSKGSKPPAKELAADLFADFAHTPQPAAMLPQQEGTLPFQQQVLYAVPGVPQPGYGLPLPQQPQAHQAHQAWAVQQQQALMWQHQQYQQQQQQQQLQQQLQQQQAAYGAMYGGIRPLQGYGVPGMPYAAVPGMNGAVPGAAGHGGVQQQQQQQGSGPPSTGSAAAAWSVTSAAAGVTEENAFADLVDLKKALPPATGISSSGGGFLPAQQLQPQAYSAGMPAALPGMAPYPAAAPGMAAGYGVAGFGAAGYGMAPAAGPGYGQPAMGLQQQASFGSNWGMPVQPSPSAAIAAAVPAAVPRVSEDSGNPFA